MVEVQIPETIKIGGFDYSVCYDDDELTRRREWGHFWPLQRQLSLMKKASPQQLNCTFIHELLHAVDDIYLADQLEEGIVFSLANGLHQIFEQLGIRFVIKEVS